MIGGANVITLEEEVESLISSIASSEHRLSFCIARIVGDSKICLVFEDVILIFTESQWSHGSDGLEG